MSQGYVAQEIAMRWFSIDDQKFANAPLWMKTFGISKEEGDIYLPAATAGLEEAVLLKASTRGVVPAMRHEHAYVPADWLTTEFPAVREICRMLVLMTEQVRPTDLECVLRYLELAAVPGELDDTAISRTMDGENYSRRQITDATWLIPIALGRRVLAGKGISFSTAFEVLTPNGDPVRDGLFAEHPIYTTAYDLRSPALSEAVVKKLALRSSEVLGYQKAMKNGSRPQDLQTGSIIFFTGTPTEAGLRRADENAKRWAHGRAT